LSGLPFGTARSTRRGRGGDLAGFRAYVPGDPISAIDWRSSAKLSSARGDDEFVVRERFADEAPYVVVLVDRRPSMGLYPEWSPWLDKPAAVRAATDSIVASALAARGAVGYFECSNEQFFLAPRGRSPLEAIRARERACRFDADDDSLRRGIEQLARGGSSLGAGSFVFVLSDFLAPLPREVWLAGAARRWELVPVVIQDPVWEQSFPSVGPVVTPIADPSDGVVLEVRLTASEARAERARREGARAELLRLFASLGLDPVPVDRAEPESVQRAFLEWAERRRRALRLRR
jgi:uncharacterized protein (DUF58 family)